jgi:hypothetical protein
MTVAKIWGILALIRLPFRCHSILEARRHETGSGGTDDPSDQGGRDWEGELGTMREWVRRI